MDHLGCSKRSTGPEATQFRLDPLFFPLDNAFAAGPEVACASHRNGQERTRRQMLICGESLF